MSFLPTGCITATVLSASSPLFVSDELLKPDDQFECPSNISMSRTCVYSPTKFICCKMFCSIYSRWVIPIGLIKFQKPTKTCRSSCCFHLQWNCPQNFRTSWKYGVENLMKCLPTLGLITKCTGLKHWNSRGNTLWINSLNVRPHQFCDRLHFRFVCVKLPLQCTWDHTNFSSVQRKLIRKNLNFLGNGRK